MEKWVVATKRQSYNARLRQAARRIYTLSLAFSKVTKEKDVNGSFACTLRLGMSSLLMSQILRLLSLEHDMALSTNLDTSTAMSTSLQRKDYQCGSSPLVENRRNKPQLMDNPRMNLFPAADQLARFPIPQLHVKVQVRGQEKVALDGMENDPCDGFRGMATEIVRKCPAAQVPD
jgi:hypothetical protein